MRCSTQTPPPAGCSSNEGTLLRWVADAWAEDACNQSPPLLPSCDGQIASCKANQGPALAAATLPLGRPGPLPACTQQGLSGLLLLLLLLCDLSQAAACCRAIQQLLPAVLTAVLLTSPPPSTRVGPDLTHYCLCNACSLTPPLLAHFTRRTWPPPMTQRRPKRRPRRSPPTCRTQTSARCVRNEVSLQLKTRD